MDLSLDLPPGPGQSAFARFVAEACGKIAALGATRCSAQAVAIIAADHPVEELFPFHVLAVAQCQGSEVALHQS